MSNGPLKSIEIGILVEGITAYYNGEVTRETVDGIYETVMNCKD